MDTSTNATDLGSLLAEPLTLGLALVAFALACAAIGSICDHYRAYRWARTPRVPALVRALAVVLIGMPLRAARHLARVATARLLPALADRLGITLADLPAMPRRRRNRNADLLARVAVLRPANHR